MTTLLMLHAFKHVIVVTNEKCVHVVLVNNFFFSVFCFVLLFSPVSIKAGDGIQCKYNGCKISNNFMIFVIS